MSALQQKQREEHEAFKNSLVDDVLGQESGDKVPMEKVVMLIWAFRGDPAVVTFMARFVAKYAGSRHVFDGIEFYLPQLAHMIIHLEVEWDDAILERFALVIAQQSLHFALQLNWILQGALQDYQPERANDGSPNPNYHALFYSRCLKLLKNVERCVVYGKPLSQELQRLYETGKITLKERMLLEQADRRFNALQITQEDLMSASTVPLDGWVLVQLPVVGDVVKKGKAVATPALAAAPPFVQRFCVLDKHVLNCYTHQNCCTGTLKLDRAISLERAEVTTDEGKFVISVKTTFYTVKMQYAKLEEMKLWARRLQEEAEMSALFASHTREAELKQDLTAEQLERYDFFQNERIFVYDLTQVAEDLRFEDRPTRKVMAPKLMAELNIPPTVYLPLCNSSDIWRRCARTVAEETRVFNTKERCPTVMHFISKRGESFRGDDSQHADPNIDVAEWMHLYLEVPDEKEKENQMAELKEEDNEEESVHSSPKNEEASIATSQHSKSKGGSSVWIDDKDEDDNNAVNTSMTSNPASPMSKTTSQRRGNRRVQRLMRESVVTLPSMLSKRLKPLKGHERSSSSGERRVVSVMDRQTIVQPLVPILEGNRPVPGGDDTDNASTGEGTVMSVERSSVMYHDQLVLGDQDEGDIDADAIDRAKKMVCGGEGWAEKSWRMLERSVDTIEKAAAHVQLEIASCLAKSYDDLRQEVFVMQMIHYYKSVFAQAKLPLWLKTYRILSTSNNTGLLELITDATSLDGLKKSEGYPAEGGLRKYFEQTYGDPGGTAFKAAQTNFMQSLASYSLVSYLLGLKDRHNGNIMIDTRGHLIFIDFGFAFGMKPGHEFSFERAPFKLTNEYMEVMGGSASDCYKEFERLFIAGFAEARKNSQIALGLVEIMMFKSNYPCFAGRRYGNGKALLSFERRLLLNIPDAQVPRRVKKLIRKARSHWGTYAYDKFQNITNGYAM